jgi:hypothetical protein
MMQAAHDRVVAMKEAELEEQTVQHRSFVSTLEEAHTQALASNLETIQQLKQQVRQNETVCKEIKTAHALSLSSQKTNLEQKIKQQRRDDNEEMKRLQTRALVAQKAELQQQFIEATKEIQASHSLAMAAQKAELALVQRTLEHTSCSPFESEIIEKYASLVQSPSWSERVLLESQQDFEHLSYDSRYDAGLVFFRRWIKAQLLASMKQWVDVTLDVRQADSTVGCLHGLVHRHVLFAELASSHAFRARCLSAWLQWKAVIEESVPSESWFKVWSKNKLSRSMKHWVSIITDDKRADAMLNCLHRMIQSDALFAQLPDRYAALAHCYAAWLQWREVTKKLSTTIDAMNIYLRRIVHMRYRVSCLRWCEAEEANTNLKSVDKSNWEEGEFREFKLKAQLRKQMQQSGVQVMLYCLKRLNHGPLVWSVERWLAFVAVIRDD